jgi:hypothetical protein
MTDYEITGSMRGYFVQGKEAPAVETVRGSEIKKSNNLVHDIHNFKWNLVWRLLVKNEVK